MSLAEDVLSDLKQRQSHYQYLHAQMEQVSQVYNNRARVALPDAADDANPTVPNLLAQGIEQLGGRISSVLPQPAFARTAAYGRLPRWPRLLNPTSGHVSLVFDRGLPLVARSLRVYASAHE